MLFVVAYAPDTSMNLIIYVLYTVQLFEIARKAQSLKGANGANYNALQTSRSN